MKAESMRKLAEVLNQENINFSDIKNIIIGNVDASEEDIEKIICEFRTKAADIPFKRQLMATVFGCFNITKYRTIDERLEIVKCLCNNVDNYNITLIMFLNDEILLSKLTNQELICSVQRMINSNYDYKYVYTILKALYSISSMSINDAWGFVNKIITDFNFDSKVMEALSLLKETEVTFTVEQINKKIEEAYLKVQKESIQNFTKSFRGFNSYDEFVYSLGNMQALNEDINITGAMLGLNTEDEEPGMPSSNRK